MVGSMVCNRNAAPAVREKVIRPVSSHIRLPGAKGLRGASARGLVSRAAEAVMAISFDQRDLMHEMIIVSISHWRCH
jgi:hypothetical protein